MESESGITMAYENCAAEESVPVLNIEGKNVDANAEVHIMNGVSEQVSKDESIESSGGVDEVATVVPPGKNLKTKKDTHGPKTGVSKGKSSKDKPNLKGATPVSRTPRSILSQSLSFPARGASVDAMKKSIDVNPVNAEVKHTQGNATKAGASFPSSRSNNVNSRVSTGALSNDENKTGGVRRTTLVSVPSTRPSTFCDYLYYVPCILLSLRVTDICSLIYQSGKTGSINKPTHSSSDVIVSVGQSLSAVKTTPLLKEHDDAHSLASSTTPGGRRSSASGFSFRLDERAERRKEFFTKLEEKIQAKEAEKNNSQAKSQENQEAEIKQLRKSLTFKAAPMPSFYKEPPPKIQIKKIPTTRPISPKLGRHKISIPSLNSPSEDGGVGLSPRLVREWNKSLKGLEKGDKIVTEPKKTIRKSQHRLNSQENGVTTAGKPSKPQMKEVSKEETKSKDKIEDEVSVNDAKESVPSAVPAPESMPQEVIVAAHAPEIVPQEVTIGA